MKKLFLLLLLFPILAQAQFTRATGYTTGNQTVIPIAVAPPGYAQAQAFIYYPDDYFKAGNETKRYPLYVFLHGAGEGSSWDINEVQGTSLPYLIKNGLKPYGIDTLTGDTVKFIVVSPHCATCGGSYSFPQLQYTIPFLYANYRIDTSCVFAGGLSSGGSCTWSMAMGNGPNPSPNDTLMTKRITGIMPMANGGYDNFINSTIPRATLDTTARRGLACLYVIGDQDPGNNGAGFGAYDAAMRAFCQPGRYYDSVRIGGTHSDNVWNIPFPLTARVWSKTMNAWTQMWELRKRAAINTLTADGGPDQTITLPTNTATLHGSGTTPSGTTITGYSWIRISGPNTPSISGGATATATLSGLIQGTYVYRLQVTNSASENATNDVTIAVNAPDPNSPIVSAGISFSITLPINSTTLTGSATPQGSNTIVGYSWKQVSGPNTSGLGSPSAAMTTVTGMIAGVYTFRFTATDNLSQKDSGDINITVTNAPTGAKRVTKVAESEYADAFLYTDSVVRKFYYNPASGHVEFASFVINGRKAIDIAPGFNYFAILDDQRYVWQSVSGSVTPTRIEVDTLGNPFNDNLKVFGYFYTFTSIRSDSTVWYWGGDDYKFTGATPTPITKPMKLNTPAGKKIVDIAMGRELILIASDGTAWVRYKGDATNRFSQIALPGKAVFAGASQYDFNIICVESFPGSTMGYPYAFGSEFSFWGGSSLTDTAHPVALKTLWGMTSPIKSLAVTNNTIHYVDSLGRMYGIGDNPNGEIGNGQELVNHFETYPTPLSWSWGPREKIVGPPAVRIAPEIIWKKVWGTGGAFAYYNWAQDVNDSTYFWGRNKSFVGGDGAENGDEGAHPNALDVLVPTMRTPLGVSPTQTQIYTLTLPTCNAGNDQTINTSSTTLSATATPTTLSASGKPNYGYTITSYKWTQLSGSACTIVSPNSASTSITGMSNGIYSFQMLVTDNNTATWADTVKVTVSLSASGPTVNAGNDQTITLPATGVTLTGSATANGGASITSASWTQISGPNTASISFPAFASTPVTGLVQGIYVFQYSATDSNGQNNTDQVVVTVQPANAGCNCLTPSKPTIIKSN